MNATHYVENKEEQKELSVFGINAAIRPSFFNDITKYKVTFKPSLQPHVWLTCHTGREKEYGVDIIERIAKDLPNHTFHIYGIKGFSVNNNVIYHDKVSEEQLDNDIKNYHSALRLNSFDGFAESVAKSILLGQYPISRILYPHVWCYSGKDETLKILLRSLVYMKSPNYKAREYWYPKLEELIY